MTTTRRPAFTLPDDDLDAFRAGTVDPLDLAADHDVSVETVHRALKRAGASRSHGQTHRLRTLRLYRALAASARALRGPRRAAVVALRHGVSVRTVYKALRAIPDPS